MSFGGLSTDFTNSFLSHLELNQHYSLTHLSSQWIHPCLSSPFNSSEFWKFSSFPKFAQLKNSSLSRELPFAAGQCTSDQSGWEHDNLEVKSQ